MFQLKRRVFAFFLQAFISPKRLTLALEPEVASVFIGDLDVQKTGSGKLSKWNPGSRFMVVDIGGKEYNTCK